MTKLDYIIKTATIRRLNEVVEEKRQAITQLNHSNHSLKTENGELKLLACLMAIVAIASVCVSAL